MKQLLLCLISFLFLTTNAQISKKNNFFLSKTASEFLAAHAGETKKANRRIRSEQILKSIHVSTAGTLVNLLTTSENNTLTDLTIIGSIDARDFRIMRDSMPNLAVLDISAVTISSYSGSDGTDHYYANYPANEIPENSFYVPGSTQGTTTSSTLTSILLPATATSVGSMAFTFCKSLASVSIPASVTKIGLIAFVGSGAKINVDGANANFSSVDGVLFDKAKTKLIQCPLSVSGIYNVPSTVDSIEMYGFCFCENLTAVNVPSSVSSIGAYAFTSCSGTINVDANNPNYSSQGGVLFNKSLTTLIQCGTSKSGSYVIPSPVDSIIDNAFYNCSLMTSVSLPSSVRFIADFSFYNCSGLTSITVNSRPVSIASTNGVFYNVNTSTCILNVPYGTKPLYQSASGWKDFSNIVENTHGFVLGTNKLILSAIAGSNAGVQIASNDAWTVSSNQSWLTVSPENGSGNDTILITSQANPVSDNRTAIVTVSADGIQPQTIQVIQSGIPKTLNLTPGGLLRSMTAAELSTVINIKISGTIDARDFKTMRDNMPKLAFLDISEVAIAAYNGPLGTASWITIYAANRIPDYAFNLGMSSQQYTLASVKLPATLTAVGDYAFYSCDALTEIVIPNAVTFIGNSAFGSCNSLANVTLPVNLTTIENSAFMGAVFSSILIPTTVKSIGTYGFGFCKNLISVNIPNSVTTISNSAFESCTALTDLTIGSSVTSIGNSAFSGCSSLTGVVIPNSVTTLDGSAFGGCTNLKSVSLPNSLAAIGYNCFYNCTSLTEIDIPASVTKIDNSAFSSCRSLTNITIPNYLTTIGYSAFSYCISLSTITIPNSVSSIGSSAFDGCTGLNSIYVNRDVPLNLSASTSIFNNVNKSTCILNVPFGTKELYTAANQWKDFVQTSENTHGLKLSADSVKLLSTQGSKVSVSIKSNDPWTVSSNQTWLTVSPGNGNGNDTLQLTAAANVTSLQRTAVVTISSGVISKTITVIQAASPKIVNITAGKLASTLTPTELNTITNLTISGTINACDFKIMRDSMPSLEAVDLSTATIVAYTGSLGTAGNYNYTYPLKEIPQSAFFNSNTYVAKTRLYSIILPASTTSIGASAFQSCNGLTNINIPDSVTQIGGSAFQRCTGMGSIHLPKSLTKIEDHAFDYCSGLTTLLIPDSIISLTNWYVFSNCTKLKSVTLGKSLQALGYAAFQNCTSLTDLVMNASLKTIGDHAFEYTALTSLTIPESVTSIGYSVFGNCKELMEAVLPNSLTLINNQTFSNCRGLKKVTFGNALTTIKSEAFYNCTNLTAINFPESVTCIESNSFFGCSSLLSITTNSLIPVDISGNSNVFKGVDKTLCALSIPYQTKPLYSTADQWKDFVNIVENAFGLKLSLTAARLSSKAGSSVDVNVISNTNWKAVSNQQWLTASSTLGLGDKLVTLTAEENTSATPRTATVTVSVVGVPEKTITITQSAAAKTIQVTAGGLSTSISSTELNTISNLILKGTIDARDFKTMRDNMPLLVDLDLSATTIVTYTGTEGTAGTYTYTYPAATVPLYGFYSLNTSKAKTSLTSVVLPASAISIGASAFQNCSGLFTIKLPETLTTINDYAFQNCTGLAEITFPNSLLTLGSYSFSGCKGLTGLKFGNSIHTINNYAFEYCSALRSVAIPNSVSTLGFYVFQNCTALSDVTFGSSLKTTGDYTFYKCKGIKSIVIPNSVTTIGLSSFESCTNLTNVTFGNSLTTIAGSAFSSCSKLDNIVIPNTVTTLDFRSFISCTSLKNITLSNSLTAIGGSAFWSCTGLTDIIIPNSVTTIGDNAFTYCSSLKNVQFSSTLKTIAGGAFSNCTGLIDVVLPNSVTTIGIYAFSGCSGMKSITIPAGISSLEYSSISCSGLTAIYSLASIPITPGSTGVFSSVNKSTCTLYVPKGSKAAYQSTPQWKDFTNISEDFGFLLESQVIHIKSGGGYTIDMPMDKIFTVESNQTWLRATIVSDNGSYKIVLASDINPDFSLRTAFITISFPNGPTRTFEVIQSGSSKTVTVSSGNLRTSLTPSELSTVSNLILSGTIDARDFRVMRDSMPQLADIDLKNTTIKAYSGTEGTNPSVGSYPANETPINAFYKTYSGVGKETLTNIILPTNLTSIGKSSFAYANGLGAIVIPDQVTVIGETAFAWCEGLKDVTIGNSVTTIGVEAFWICTKLAEITIPYSVTTISKEAFSNCTALRKVNFSNNLTSLGIDAFSSSGLTSVELPSSLTTLSEGAFRYCRQLTKVVVPASITEIKYNAFYYCPALTEVVLPQTLQIIGPEVFGYCTALKFISIPASVNKIGYNAFANCVSLASIYANPTVPVDLTSTQSSNVFAAVVKANCTLFIPKGSKSLYQAAIQWKDFSNIIEMTTAGITLTNANVSIYPNPVKESFSITGLQEPARVILTDINGKQVFTRKIEVGENMPVSDLANGMYIVKIVTPDGTLERKLIKE